jgi:molecular chaperone GrpE
MKKDKTTKIEETKEKHGEDEKKPREVEKQTETKTAEEKPKSKPKPKTLEEKYDDALKEIEELKKKRMYLQAEMENSQKIALKRIENNKHSIKVNVISNFLPIVDSFEAAISKYESTSKQDYQQLLGGLKSLQKQFLQVLTGLGIKPIEKINVPFNYKEHDVFMKMVDEEYPEDTVIKIAQKGYYIGENVLRPAKVIVSKKKEKPKAIPVEAKVIDSEDSTTEKVEQVAKKSDINMSEPSQPKKSNPESTAESDYIS